VRATRDQDYVGARLVQLPTDHSADGPRAKHDEPHAAVYTYIA
jgi:hypothetical protein